jgi:hypothetical protein
MTALRCSACGGPYSEPTGHILGDRTRLCGTCAKDFLSWVKSHTSRRWGKLRFYDYAFPAGETGETRSKRKRS